MHTYIHIYLRMCGDNGKNVTFWMGIRGKTTNIAYIHTKSMLFCRGASPVQGLSPSYVFFFVITPIQYRCTHPNLNKSTRKDTELYRNTICSGHDIKCRRISIYIHVYHVSYHCYHSSRCYSLKNLHC